MRDHDGKTTSKILLPLVYFPRLLALSPLFQPLSLSRIHKGHGADGDGGCADLALVTLVEKRLSVRTFSLGCV